MRRLRVLLSAYACQPGHGSEPGVGWSAATHLSRYHDVWVLTRAENRAAIEAAQHVREMPNLHFRYHNVPAWPDGLQRGHVMAVPAARQLHYMLWQMSAASTAASLHREVGFDAAQHLTYVRYWMPTALHPLPIPLIWGPVGGGESVPASFLRRMNFRSRSFEMVRSTVRAAGENLPAVARMAERCQLALATTDESAARLRKLGARKIEVCSETALDPSDIGDLGRLPVPEGTPLRFISIGRLLSWKGVDLGLHAFRRAELQNAEYWVIGDGPESARLSRLASDLGIEDRVRFFGRLPRHEVFDALARCHVLVHPSLHDSGGWTCLEAMAARRPVICLNLGGPGTQVPSDAGIRVDAHTREQAVQDIASAMRRLADDHLLRSEMGAHGHRHVANEYDWSSKAESMARRILAMVEQTEELNAVGVS